MNRKNNNNKYVFFPEELMKYFIKGLIVHYKKKYQEKSEESQK